jgi:hypothetical protein
VAVAAAALIEIVKAAVTLIGTVAAVEGVAVTAAVTAAPKSVHRQSLISYSLGHTRQQLQRLRHS